VPTKITQTDSTFSNPEKVLISEDFSINRGFPQAYNCDLKEVGKVEKSSSKEGISYKATGGGANCDYLNYPNLKYSQAYVLRIEGENKVGRSLKIYLFNQMSQVPELEEILPKGTFDENYYIYPKTASGSGYTLNLETRSFGRISSENLLTKVEFYPVNYIAPQVVENTENNLKILNVKKYGTWGYKVETQGSGLIELGQGYEKGWIAFQLPINNLKFKILEHIKVNSWANAWLVPSNSLSPFTFYIVFWPQLLEWGGFLVGGITFLVLVLKRRKRHPIT
jgi:hypothetical protein